MIIKNLPHDFSNEEEKKMPVIFRTYRATQLAARNKSVIHENMIDIVLSGKKKIVNIGEVAHLEAGDLILLAKGNNLISEVLPENGLFNSLVIYFTNEKLTVAQRLGKVEDIVPVIGFLASAGAQWVTAQTIFVNGGYLAR